MELRKITSVFLWHGNHGGFSALNKHSTPVDWNFSPDPTLVLDGMRKV